MRFSDLIYFDQAATSFPKPPAVLKAVRRALTEAGGNPGRSGHRLSVQAAMGIYACREDLAAFFDAPSPEGVIFTQNATHALNLAIFGFAKDNGHILLSDVEHNAVFRPVYHLSQTRGISYELYPSGKDAEKEIERRIRDDTCLVIATHASNVFGRILPVEKIGAVCQRHGVPFLIDASQSAGHIPVSMKQMHATALAAPAHKGLYGIQGAGFLILAESLPLSPLVFGGSGSLSTSPSMPKDSPERFEAGTLPTPAIFALRAGLKEVRTRGVSQISEKIRRLEAYLKERLADIPSLRQVLPEESGSGIISFNAQGLSPALLGELLDGNGIALRSGLHCAPLAHKALGTEKEGTLRLSLGYTNTQRECEIFLSRLNAILKKQGKKG